MKVVTAQEMKDIDAGTIRDYGIAGLVLMEKAGLAVTSKIKEIFGRKKIVVLCGSGNNGGDGLVVARQLHNEGWDARVFLTSQPQYLSPDAVMQYHAAERFGVQMYPIEKFFQDYQTIISGHSLVVDAIFGTGLNKPVRGNLVDVINFINKSGRPVVSVDIPSGISADNGQVLGCAVNASCTVTFGLPKRGHLLYPGAKHTGTLYVADIGFPRALVTSPELPVERLEPAYVSSLIPSRDEYSHKGTYGHVFLIAGSRGKTGAARMAARASLRSGAGLVTVAVPSSIGDMYQCCFTEEMTLTLPDTGSGTLSAKASQAILDFIHTSATVVAIGPGMGVNSDTKKILLDIIKESTCPVLIDADAIRVFGRTKKALPEAKAPLIFTPHPGEMTSLVRDSFANTSAIERDRINTALSFARENRSFLVLKGVPTIISTPDGRAFVNSTGNPGMATAGSGDVLTGMISGLLAQNRDPLRSCILGVYLHGLAGDIAASKRGQHSLIATDITDEIPNAFHSLMSLE